MLWSINTTPNRSKGYMPFFMVYVAEAVLPINIRHNSPHMAAYVEADNEKARQDALDLLDEDRDLAAAWSAIYQQDLRCYYSRRVKTRTVCDSLIFGPFFFFCFPRFLREFFFFVALSSGN